MVSGYQLRGYVVNPLGVDAIRDMAAHVRQTLGMNDGKVDLGKFLEELVEYGVVVDVIDEDDMPGISAHAEAYCIPENLTIYLTSRTYKKAIDNDPRTRFTIFHELGHLVLQHTRPLHRGGTNKSVKPFQDSEWQADQFAAEILMPLEEIKRHGLLTASDIRDHFGVSQPAAQRRYNQMVSRGDVKI